jgi:hypothetical protein
MNPGAAAGEPGVRIGHNPTLHVSEAAQGHPRGAFAAAHASAEGDSPLNPQDGIVAVVEGTVAYVLPTTSVSLPSSAWWVSRPQ